MLVEVLQWVEDKDKEGEVEDESCWLWAEEDDEQESGDDIEKLVGLWMLVEVLQWVEDKDKEEDEEEDENCLLLADELNENNGKFEVFKEPGEREKEGKMEKGIWEWRVKVACEEGGDDQIKKDLH